MIKKIPKSSHLGPAKCVENAPKVLPKCSTNVHFSIEGAMAEALHRIKSVDGDIEILARVVDHACSSQQCISHRVATMCGEAKWKISTDLCNDQPLDACGYIAADAVCRLREAALAEANDWHRTKFHAQPSAQ